MVSYISLGMAPGGDDAIVTDIVAVDRWTVPHGTSGIRFYCEKQKYVKKGQS